jgi:hypothetical protein
MKFDWAMSCEDTKGDENYPADVSPKTAAAMDLHVWRL